eukprot:scaffold201726_cov32-Tisochrysis_lutea.AAC.1
MEPDRSSGLARGRKRLRRESDGILARFAGKLGAEEGLGGRTPKESRVALVDCKGLTKVSRVCGAHG